MTQPRATIHEVPRTAPGSAGERPVRRGSTASAPNVKPAPRSVPGFLRQERLSFGYAFEGVGYCWRTQPHLRIHASVALVVIGLGVFFRIATAEWAALLALITLVAALEMLNTVVEVIVDMVTAEFHPAAKVAKDVAAGAVLVASIGAAIVGVFIFLPRLFGLLR